MSTIDEILFVERMNFFNGQRLFAADLQSLEAFNREMRWLHNRSLHQPGIGRGYAVTGDKGDRQVTVSPGYAIDSFGREIVLTKTRTIQVPPVAGDKQGRSVFFDLTVAYQETDLEEVEFRDGLCETRGAVRLREAPVLCWVPLEGGSGELRPSTRFAKDILEGRKIIIGRVEVLNCQLQQVVSIAQRQSALPDCGPYIACGTANPTNWIDAGDATEGEESFIILRAEIDTSAAGFQITPCYSAHIPGPRMMEGMALPLIDYLRILDSRPDGLTVLLLIRQKVEVPIPVGLVEAGATAGETRRRARAATANPARAGIVEWIKTNWRVMWMGVEG